MKKFALFLALLMSLTLIFCSCGKNEEAADGKKSGSENITDDGFSYIILDDGTAEITGYSAEKAISSLTIPDSVSEGIKVTSIADEAFADNNKLEYVTFPRYITKIGKNAFKGSSVRNAIMVSSRSLVEIGEGAFENCSSLVQADLPESLRTIGNNAFVNCSSLIVITFRGDMASIDAAVFEGCRNFKICTYAENKSVLAFANECGHDVQLLEKA